MLPIPGTASLLHLEENMGAADIELSTHEIVELDGDRGGTARIPGPGRRPVAPTGATTLETGIETLVVASLSYLGG